MLNLKILMIAASIIFATATLNNIIMIYYFKKNKALKYFLGFNIAFLLGLTLMILRNSIPDFFAIIIGNTFLAAGYVSLYIATQGFFKQEIQWRNRYLIPVFVVFAGMMFYTYAFYDGDIRIIIFSLFCAIYGVTLGRLFWKYGNGKFRIFFKFTALLSFSSTGLFLLRAFTTSTVDIPISYLQVNVLPYVYLIVMVMLLNVLFSLQTLHNNRA